MRINSKYAKHTEYPWLRIYYQSFLVVYKSISLPGLLGKTGKIWHKHLIVGFDQT